MLQTDVYDTADLMPSSQVSAESFDVTKQTCRY